jgi:peptide deformylase
MVKLDILTYGNQILRENSKEIKNIDDDIIKLSQNMIETVSIAKGLGLAAPQVGKNINLISVALPEKEKISLINPKIILSEGKEVLEEGCLSCPGIQIKISRAKKIGVEALNLKGKKVEIEAQNLLARIILHEIDHLRGILFIDLLSPVKRFLIAKRLKALLKKKE